MRQVGWVALGIMMALLAVPIASAQKYFVGDPLLFNFNYEMITKPYITGALNDSSETMLFDRARVFNPACTSTYCEFPIRVTYGGVFAAGKIFFGKSNITSELKAIKNSHLDDIELHDIELLVKENFSYTKNIGITSCEKQQTANGSVIDACTTANYPKHVAGWRYVPKKLDNVELLKDKEYIINIIFKRKPQFGEFSTDIIPSFIGYKFKELAVVNSSYLYQYNESLKTSFGALRNVTLLSNTTVNTAELIRLGHLQNVDCTDMLVYDENDVRVDFDWDLYYNASNRTGGFSFNTGGGCGASNTGIWTNRGSVAAGNTTRNVWNMGFSSDTTFKNSSANTFSRMTAFYTFGTHLDRTGNGNNLQTSSNCEGYNWEASGITGVSMTQRGCTRSGIFAPNISYKMPWHTDNWTVSMWYKYNAGSVNNNFRIWDQPVGNGIEFGLGMFGNRNDFLLTSAGANCREFTGYDRFIYRNGTWHWIAIQYISTAADDWGTFKIWIGNSSQYALNMSANSSADAFCAPPSPASTPAGIGMSFSGDGANWNSSVDNVRIWVGAENRMPTEADLNATYANERSYFSGISRWGAVESAINDPRSTDCYVNMTVNEPGSFGVQCRWQHALDAQAFNVSLIEHNFTGTTVNVTGSRVNQNISFANFTNVLEGGYQWRIFANDTDNDFNVSATQSLSVGQRVGLGNITIEAYSERNLTAVRGIQLLVTNSTGSSTFFDFNNSFRFTTNSIPTGNITIYVINGSILNSSRTFVTRPYIIDFNNNANTNLTAYLLGDNEGRQHNFIVIDEQDIPIEGANITIQRVLVNGSRTVHSEFSGGNGKVQAFLEQNVPYRVSISKAGFSNLVLPNLKQDDSGDIIILRKSALNLFSFAASNVTITPSPPVLGVNMTNVTFGCAIIDRDENLVSYGYNLTYNLTVLRHADNATLPAQGGNFTENVDLSDRWGNITMTCFFTKSGFSQFAINFTYPIHNMTANAILSLPAILTGLGTLGLSAAARAFISLFMTAGVGAFFSRFNAISGMLAGFGVLAVFTFGLLWFDPFIYVVIFLASIALMLMARRGI